MKPLRGPARWLALCFLACAGSAQARLQLQPETASLTQEEAEATRQLLDAAAQEGDPQRLAERVCDVNFYLAELDLARNDAAAAKPKLERAAEMCPFASFERMGATAELTRLK